MYIEITDTQHPIILLLEKVAKPNIDINKYNQKFYKCVF